MPPRRSTARAGSSTPVSVAEPSPPKRSIRTGSALPPGDPGARQYRRAVSLQPSEASVSNVNNPNLPEIQLGRSYAYGSKKAAALPAQLVARNRMNLREMADQIDAGVQQADQNLEAEQEQSPSPREERARRRATRSSSREGSVEKDDVENRKTQRTAAWASSLESSQLDEIPEEDSEADQKTPEIQRHQETPSSFPSGVFDHSYNYERGLRGPNITIRARQEPILRRTWTTVKGGLARTGQRTADLSVNSGQRIRRLFRVVGATMFGISQSPLTQAVATVVFAIFIAVTTILFFCTIYTTSVCDPFTNSPLGQLLQKHCGRCTRSVLPPHKSIHMNMTSASGFDLDRLVSAINVLDTRLHHLESNVGSRFESLDSSIQSDVDALRRHQLELASHVARLHQPRGLPNSDVPSPVIGKVNYFSPSNGAIVNPHLTSPTRQKPLPFAARMALRTIGLARYTSKPPATALQAWQDVGDCWCSSATGPGDQDSMRLAVDVAEWIYPTELVLENYPSGGSLYPGATPKAIELWADFSHLDSHQWDALGIRDLQGAQPLGPTLALLGRVEYDARVEAAHVQEFPLHVNQGGGRVHYAQKFVVRVVSNYGSDYSCLYRVRLHGVSVYAPQPTTEGA